MLSNAKGNRKKGKSMRRSSLIHLMLSASAVPGLLAATATPALAADQPAAQAPDQPDDGEIVVTAEKRSGSASRIGLSITALSGEAIQSARISDTRDIVRFVPGFTAAQSITNTPIYTLRGIGFNTPNLSSTSPVGIYVNDTAYAYPYMTQQTAYDLERVEVLKGPQGTLYGRNTTGGLVKFVTARPGDRFEADAEIGYGSYQTVISRGYVSGPLSDTVGARLAWTSENSSKGWQKSVTRGERLGEKDRQAARLTLVWNPDSAFRAQLVGSFWRDGSDTQAPQAILYAPETPAFALPDAAIAPSLLLNAKNNQADWTPANVPGPRGTSPQRPAYRSDATFYSAALELSYDFADGMVANSSTAFNRVRRHDMNDVNGIPFETLSYEPRGHINSLSQEIRLSKSTPELSWTVGGYASRDDIFEGQVAWLDNFSTVQLIRFVGGTVPNPYTAQQIAEGLRLDDAVADIKTRSYSLFGNIQPQITPTLKATIGARYTSDWTHYSGCTRDVGNNASPVWNVVVAGVIAGLPNPNLGAGDCITFLPDFSAFSGEVKDKLKEDNLSWRLALDWTPSSTSLVYASVSRGFKSGGFPIVAANISSQLAPFKQEKVTAYELGAKLRLFGGAVRTSSAIFYNDYRDKQVYTVVADPIFRTLERTQNVPKSEIYGAETEVEWRIAPGLSWRGALSYIHTNVLEYQGFDQDGVAQNFRGDSFPYSPKWQASGGLTHRFDLANGMAVTSVANISYQSRSHADFRDYARYNIRAYALVDGSVTLAGRDDRWRASLWVKNLFDKDYWTSVNYGRDVYVRFAGMPRTMGATLAYHFN